MNKNTVVFDRNFSQIINGGEFVVGGMSDDFSKMKEVFDNYAIPWFKFEIIVTIVKDDKTDGSICVIPFWLDKTRFELCNGWGVGYCVARDWNNVVGLEFFRYGSGVKCDIVGSATNYKITNIRILLTDCWR